MRKPKKREETPGGKGQHLSILLLGPVAAVTPQRQDGSFNGNSVWILSGINHCDISVTFLNRGFRSQDVSGLGFSG